MPSRSPSGADPIRGPRPDGAAGADAPRAARPSCPGRRLTGATRRVFRAVSPHLDDAVLSCGLLLAGNPGSRVTTVFASGPAHVDPLTEWDRASRLFHDGDDVISARRREEARAAAILGAVSEPLEFWDSQYRYDERFRYAGPTGQDLLDAVERELARIAEEDPVDAWLVPLGLGHDDHRLTARAALAAATKSGVDCYVYQDLPYALERAEETREQLEALESKGLRFVPDASLCSSEERSLKREAVRCYRSQRRGLGRRARRAIRGPEQFLRLDAR